MYLWPAYIRLWNGMNSRIRFWQNWEFFSSVSWQTFELIKTRSCGVQTPTYPTDFHHRWWRLRHTKVRASTKAAGWGFHSEVRVLCEVLGCGFLHLRNLHEELILGSNIVVGSRCSCVAGGVRIILVSELSRFCAGFAYLYFFVIIVISEINIILGLVSDFSKCHS